MSSSTYIPTNILLTGGAGFIGSNTVLFLCRKYPQYRFIVLDKLDVCSSLRNLDEAAQTGRVQFVKGDIQSADLVSHLLKEYSIDTIMHFAAETHVDNSFGNSITFTESNIRGTHVLLECTRAAAGQIKRFIHVSTDEVYGEIAGHIDERCTESDKLNPTNPYAATKVGAEFLVKSYQSSFGLPCIITRGNNVYGPRQYPEKMIPKFLNLLARGQPCPLHGSGKNRRSFLYVEDVAGAFDVILHKGSIGSIYNIGSEEEFENIEVLKMLIQIFREKYPQLLDASRKNEDYIQHVRDRAFNDFRYHISSDALLNLGWVRKYVNFREGLEATIAWYMDHPNHWSQRSVELALKPHPFLDAHAQDIDAKNADIDSPKGSAKVIPVSAPVQQISIRRWLIFGGRGWIGSQVVAHIRQTYPLDTVMVASSRADDDAAVEQEILATKPNRVVSLIGRTHGEGFTTIDYLEQPGKLPINIRDNLYSPLILSIICQKHNIHFTYLGTGCIFKYDQIHANGSGVGFTEADQPNFFGSSYSIVKGYTDRLFHLLNTGNTLNVRIRMPITGDRNPRNFITKITTYKKICSVENSMTVLPELIPIMIEMAIARETGTVNLTNPGTISHNRILEMYREIVDPSFKWENFSEEEQRKILAADRSNNLLETDRLKQFAPRVMPIEESVRAVLMQMKANEDAAKKQ